jgi:uncharacterized coiled-coil DUF342 family protein
VNTALTREIVAQVEELSEKLVKRNAEIKRLTEERDRLADALKLIQRCVRNSREAPNALDTIAFVAREALVSLPVREAGVSE